MDLTGLLGAVGTAVLVGLLYSIITVGLSISFRVLNYPDLTVYFDDLSWRSAGTLGHDSKYLPENDRGPDDAVHSHHGVFLYYDPKKKMGGTRIEDISLLDIAPTVLRILDVPVPKDMEGRNVEEVF